MEQLPRLGLGCAPLGNLYHSVPEEQALAVVEAAFDTGCTYLDTAPHYGLGLSEERLGRALAGRDRSSYVLSTKVGRRLRPLRPGERVDGQGFVDTPATRPGVGPQPGRQPGHPRSLAGAARHRPRRHRLSPRRRGPCRRGRRLDRPHPSGVPAKPAIARGDWEPWASQLRQLAALPNIVCKLSGLTTEADWEKWRPQDVLPYARHVLDAFGPDRVLFGSDWPLCTLAGRYADVFAVAEQAVAALSPSERAAVFGGNAVRVYGLGQARSGG